jgi:hypothetical protein
MHGEKGQGLAQFYIPHSVAVDNYQRVGTLCRTLQYKQCCVEDNFTFKTLLSNIVK